VSKGSHRANRKRIRRIGYSIEKRERRISRGNYDEIMIDILFAFSG
jgi:predicted nucleotidyltransferase